MGSARQALSQMLNSLLAQQGMYGIAMKHSHDANGSCSLSKTFSLVVLKSGELNWKYALESRDLCELAMWKWIEGMERGFDRLALITIGFQ